MVPWDPKHYHDGLHHITVTVVDKNNRKNEVTQPFRLDEKQTVYHDTLAQLMLHTHTITIFKSLFWFSVMLCTAPLIFFRIWHELIKGETNFMINNTIFSNSVIVLVLCIFLSSWSFASYAHQLSRINVNCAALLDFGFSESNLLACGFVLFLFGHRTMGVL